MNKLILFIAIMAYAISSVAQCETPNELLVEGKASLKIIPEQIIYRVQISASHENYAQCTEMVIEKAQKIKDKFITNGIDPDLIKTTNYAIREIREHDHVTRKSVFKGYKATIPVLIKAQTNYPKNDVIFEIIKNNFNADFNLSFALTPQQKEKAKEKLIAMAVEDAQEKAKIIKESAGVQTHRIANIQYGEPQLISGYARPNYKLQNEQLMLRGSSDPGITSTLNPAEIEMQTRIIIAWCL